MKILHLTRHLEIGGIPRYVVDLCCRFQAKGHKMAVASTGGTQVTLLEAAGVRHVMIPLSSKFEFGLNLWRSWLALLPVLREPPRFDIVHAHTRMAQVLAALIQKFHGIPSVATCHGFFKPNIGRRLWPCWGQKVIAVSRAVEVHLAITHKVDRSKIVCIYNGIDAGKYKIRPDHPDIMALRAKFNIPPSARVVGSTARLCPVKGLEYLIEAFSLCLKKRPDLFCLIVGDGDSRKALEDLAQKLKVAQQVIFTGIVPDVAPYLMLMDIFVLPSLMEGLGLSLLEAFAAGKAVVASRAGGIVDVVRDKENALLVTPRSTSEIAAAIELLFRDEKLAQGLAEKGSQTVEQEFSLDRTTREVEEIYISTQRSFKK